MAPPAPSAAGSTAPPPPTLRPRTDYASLSHRDLLLAVQSGCDQPDHPETKAAQTAFYYRYMPYVLKRATWKLRLANASNGGAEEVSNDVFIAFFETPRRFDPTRTPDDDDLLAANLRCYLGRLARWRASDQAAFYRSIGAHAADASVIEFQLNQAATRGVPDHMKDDAPPAPSTAEELAEEFMASLSDPDADIFRTYFTDDHPGQKSDRLPRGIVEALAAKYGITPSAIRHRKAKLLKAFEAHVHAK